MSANAVVMSSRWRCEVIIFFPIYGEFAATGKPELENFQHSSHTIDSSKGIIFVKICRFFAKNADISKIKGVLLLKVIFSEITYVCTYVLNFKFLA